MRARQMIGGAAFPPDELRIIFEAFEDAWSELVSEVPADPEATDSARVILATIILDIATVGPVDRLALKSAAMDAFRLKHPLT